MESILLHFDSVINSIKIGMPTGRLRVPDIISVLGVEPPKRIGRELFLASGRFVYFYSRTKVYPQMVAMNDLDVAFVGSDALEAGPYAQQCNVVWSELQQGVRVVLAGSTQISKGKLLRVVTPFPEWAQKVIGELGIPHTIYAVTGGSEGLVAHGLADAVFDIVETGETLRDNGLEILMDFGQLHTCCIVKSKP